MRQRAEWLAHVQQTTSPYNLPEIGRNIADNANRDGVAERVAELAVPKPLEVDLALLTSDDERLQDLARSLLKTAQPHEAHPLYLVHTVPGIGKSLRLVRRDELHDLDRFPTGQDVIAYGRLVTCAKASAGTRLGPSGKNIGNARRTWAFSEAAAVCLRHHPAGQT
jgi:transposase